MDLESLKIGESPSFNADWVRSFKTKDEFIKYPHDAGREVYLSDIWDLAHRKDELKAAATVTEFDQETGEPVTPVIVTEKKTATKRNSESKKE